jgi:hypothetical protein
MRDNLDELRHIEGFPLGEDEDLHALSNPPHYTAYPNPHIAEFIRKYGKPYDEATDDYHREPYVADVSEGKGDPIYNAHSYHTKVPYKAVTPFIEHYTKPEDIVFDGFCGTGMVGVAAQMVNRRAIICDLSTAATHIAYNYNKPINLSSFDRVAQKLIEELRNEFRRHYETKHIDGRRAQIKYSVWSDVFLCPYCNYEFSFWDLAVDPQTGRMRNDLKCLQCNAGVTKRELIRVFESVYDQGLLKQIKRIKQMPVLINYKIGSNRLNKRPTDSDLELIHRVEVEQIPYWYPIFEIPEGDKTGEATRIGINYVHQFYSKRNLWVLASIWEKISTKIPEELSRIFLFAFSGMLDRASKMYRWNADRPTGTLPGTLYFPSLGYEFEPIDMFERRLSACRKLIIEISRIRNSHAMVTTQSVTHLPNISENTIDYIFTDPPFGDNLMYSELITLQKRPDQIGPVSTLLKREDS